LVFLFSTPFFDAPPFSGLIPRRFFVIARSTPILENKNLVPCTLVLSLKIHIRGLIHPSSPCPKPPSERTPFPNYTPTLRDFLPSCANVRARGERPPFPHCWLCFPNHNFSALSQCGEFFFFAVTFLFAYAFFSASRPTPTVSERFL